ncbi:MAG: hypothetical protein OEV86_15955 [Candidatus Krumholzibacteria bacterium]|nr:hypothetical protein [Candidatus Krumholzibacteria bacterium]
MKAPIRVDQYDCPDCYHRMTNYHKKDRQEVRVTCHNCRKEYTYKLVEQLGVYQWQVPAKPVALEESITPDVLASVPTGVGIHSMAITPDAAPENDNGVLNPPRRGPGRPRKVQE